MLHRIRVDDKGKVKIVNLKKYVFFWRKNNNICIVPACEWETRREEGDCVGACGEGIRNVTLVTVVTKEKEGDGKPCNETHVREETCDTGVSCPGEMQTVKMYERLDGHTLLGELTGG